MIKLSIYKQIKRAILISFVLIYWPIYPGTALCSDAEDQLDQMLSREANTTPICNVDKDEESSDQDPYLDEQQHELEHERDFLNSLFSENPDKDKPDGSCDESNSEYIKEHLGLSIDGGGMRGIIPAVWLQMLEEEINDRFRTPSSGRIQLRDVFSYIGGTSIGGILALGLAHGIPASDFITMFEEHGEKIFSRSFLKKIDNPFGIRKNLYGSKLLKELLQEKFGECTLNDLPTRVLVTACKRNGTPVLFDNASKGNAGPYKLWDTALSTSAAPTYFEAHELDREASLVDGGIWVNNPSVLVYGRMMKEVKDNNFGILSLGTGEITDVVSIGKRSGKLKVIVPLLEALMYSNSVGNHKSMDELMGENYYSRINVKLEKEIKLDAADKETIEYMKDLAKGEKKKIADFVAKNRRTIRHILEKKGKIAVQNSKDKGYVWWGCNIL